MNPRHWRERKLNSVKFILRSTIMAAACCAITGLVGCRRSPTFSIVGSFFPAWLVSMSVGVVLALVANRLLVRFRLDQEIVLPIVVYPCLALLFACTLWLIFFS